MRAQAMERLKETKKRVTSDRQLDEGSKRRKSSSNVYDIMRESVECSARKTRWPSGKGS